MNCWGKTQKPADREWVQLNIISEQVSIWAREFPPDFFDHLHRVMGVTKPGRNNHSNYSSTVTFTVFCSANSGWM